MLDPARRYRGIRVREPVSLVDLPATLLALADSSRAIELPGFSLLPLVGGEPGQVHSAIVSELPRGIGKPEWLPVSHGPLRSVTSGEWHYIRNAEGVETLMDLRGAPEGCIVSPRTPAQRRLLARMRVLLDSAISRQDDPS